MRVTTRARTKGTQGPASDLSPDRATVAVLLRAQAGMPVPALAPLVDQADPVDLMTTLLRARVLAPLAGQLVDDQSVRLPGWFTQRAEHTRTAARHRGLLQSALLDRALGALVERGIPVAPLKGTTLAEWLYGDLGARESSDLDLLVHPGRMDDAVIALKALGWHENRLAAPRSGLPPLHRVLEHPTYPPIEVHWRVHWYEDAFADRALDRGIATADGWLRLAPADELATLLLFLARDGFAGLRQVVDLAAWWRVMGKTDTGNQVRALAVDHPELVPSLGASARWAESWIGLDAGTLMAAPDRLSARQQAALRLANPWGAGSGHQVDADVSLIDGLLAPPGQAAAFVRRRLAPPAHETIMRRPALQNASPARLAAARAGHGLRVAARYVLALPTMLTGRRQSSPAHPPG